jgi:hypothetical protein
MHFHGDTRAFVVDARALGVDACALGVDTCAFEPDTRAFLGQMHLTLCERLEQGSHRTTHSCRRNAKVPVSHDPREQLWFVD